MPRCPACGRSVQPVKGTIADYYCALCDEVFDVEELDAGEQSVAEQCGDTEFEWGYDPD